MQHYCPVEGVCCYLRCGSPIGQSLVSLARVRGPSSLQCSVRLGITSRRGWQVCVGEGRGEKGCYVSAVCVRVCCMHVHFARKERYSWVYLHSTCVCEGDDNECISGVHGGLHMCNAHFPFLYNPHIHPLSPIHSLTHSHTLVTHVRAHSSV